MSESRDTVRHRPVVLTIAVVLVYLNALASIAVGILVLLSRYDVPGTDRLPVSLIGAGTILFGLLVLAVASGAGRGSALSRILLTVYIAALLVLAVFTVVSTDGWDWSAILNLAVEAFILVALWVPPVSRFVRAQAAVAAAPVAS